MRLGKRQFFAAVALVLLFGCASAFASEKVVLLHGLGRTPRSMAKMERLLSAEGFDVANVGYPSRRHSIEELADIVRTKIMKEAEGHDRVHLVAHSMGAIVIRYIQREMPIPKLGRVVMLAPPNHGSEVIDRVGHMKWFRLIDGPAGPQLATAEDGFISTLGPANFELGVIAGDRSCCWILSWMIPGRDDGKVSIESARLEGMQAFKIVRVSHTFIMRKGSVIEDVAGFLRSGKFTSA